MNPDCDRNFVVDLMNNQGTVKFSVSPYYNYSGFYKCTVLALPGTHAGIMTLPAAV